MTAHAKPNSCWIKSFGLAFILLTALLGLLSGCGRDREDPLARYLPAMKPEYQGELAALTTLPRYAVDVELFPVENLLRGNMRLELVNTSPDPWLNVVFRLYPELADYKGNMAIHNAAVNGKPVSFNYQTHDTALLVPMPEVLYPDERAVIELSWTLDIPIFADHSSVYVLFGRSQQMYTLPLFYPSLAVYQPEKGVNGEWWRAEGSIRGDSAFNVASLFVVTATMPADQVPVTSGTLITSTFIEGQRARHVWVTGPSREFLLHTSPQFQSVQSEAYGTRVTSYWLPGQEAMGRAALNYGIAALRIYSQRFGSYPYRDMRIAPAPLNFRGMEYPQVNLLGIEVYDQYRSELELLLAHEVAHQWWYQIVHNDPVHEPWLDEALAEYSMKLYLEELRGESSAANLLLSRWSLPVKGMSTEGEATPIDMPVDDFATASLYETIVYAKGALFYDSIHQTLGERRFQNFLRDYLAANRYGIVTTADWFDAVAALNTPALEVLYESWVQRPVRRPNPTPTPLIDRSSAQR